METQGIPENTTDEEEPFREESNRGSRKGWGK